MLGLCLLQVVAAAEPLPLVLEERAGGWDVYEGFETAITTGDFAARVGDLQTLETLSQERDAARHRKFLLIGAGVLVMGTAGLPWYLEDYAFVDGITETDINPGTSLDAVKHNQTVVIESHRAWSGAFLATSGLLIAVSGPLAWRGSLDRQRAPENYYTVSHARYLVEDYNDSLAPPAPASEGTEPAAEPLGGPELLLPEGTGPLGLHGAAGGL